VVTSDSKMLSDLPFYLLNRESFDSSSVKGSLMILDRNKR